jgi:predicted lipoprotein
MLAGCSGADGAGDRDAAVVAVVDEVVVPAHAELAETAGTLAEQTAALCSTPSEDQLTAAREAWRAAMSARAAERPVALGPAMERTSMAELDWLADPERIDEILAGDEPLDAGTVGNGPAGAKGLLAAEYLLFGPQADGLARGDDRRCAYAQHAAALVAEETDRLHTAFTNEVADDLAGRSDVSPIADAVIDELVNTQVHVLDDLSDTRLDPDLPPDEAEGPAQHNAAWTRAALETIAQTYDPARLGGQLPDEIGTDVDSALTGALDTLEGVDTLAGSDPQVRQQVHSATEDVRVAVRTDVVSALDVVLGFSDNDGDSG